MFKTALLIDIFFSLMSSLSAAENLPARNNPYQTFVAVTQTDEASQQAALKQALIQVLSKRSGNRKVFSKAAQQGKLQAYAKQYLQQYEYRKIQNQAFLMVRFTPDLDELLPKFGLNVWNNEFRPAILSWIVLEQSSPLWLHPEEAKSESDWLNFAAEQQGLSLLYPLLDLEDRQLLNFTEISKANKRLLQASAIRYNAPVVLSGVVSEKNTQWQGKWKLIINGKEQFFESQQADLPSLLQDSMGAVLERVAPAFFNGVPNVPVTNPSKPSPESSNITTITPTMGNNQPFTLQVSNVTNLQDYNKLQQYLKELPQVSQLQTLQITPNSVSFQINLKTDNLSFMQMLNNSQVLVPNGDNNYRYVP